MSTALAERTPTRTNRPVADPGRPGCVDARSLFTDSRLETEPTASSSAKVRRQYAALAAQAGEICSACPMLASCLYRAVVECDVSGFVAGTSEAQRRQIRARLRVSVDREDFDRLAGVAGGQRPVDHAEVVRVRRAHPTDSLEQLAQRLNCSLSTVKRHLRQHRLDATADLESENQADSGRHRRPSRVQIRNALAETLAEISDTRRIAA